MTCHVCKAQIASGSRFCSVCGSSTEPVVVSVTGANSRFESLLAEANLFRLRSQWTEAEKRCVDVMRVDANNVHAHTLLGDIYRDQGKRDEARQWYQMALDLDPENRPLQTKLREVGRVRTPRPPSIPTPPSSPKRSVSASLGTQNLMGLSPTNWFRVIWVFCGLFAVVVIGLVFWMRSHPRVENYMPTGTLKGVPETVPDAVRKLPDGTLRTPDNSVTGTQKSPGQSPAPRLNPTNNSPTPSGGLAQPPPAGMPSASREQALTAQLSQPGVLPNDVALSGLTLDPRSSRVSVSLMQRAPAELVEADLKAAIARAALLVAQAAFTADTGLQSAVVTTRLVGPDGQARPYFEAGIDRAAAQRTDPALRDEERFTGVWWATGTPNGTNRQ